MTEPEMTEPDLVAARSRERRIAQSPRFKDGRFWNTTRVEMMQSFQPSMAWEFLAGRRGRSPRVELPIFDRTRAMLSTAPALHGLRVTWLGHSTLLIEIDGVRLLTDPVWGGRIGPLALGPKRFHQPPLALSELPEIDAVVLSHDHYDHLDAWTIRALAKGAAMGFSGRVITMLGVGAHLERLGIAPENIVELDWGEGTRVGNVDVVAAPAQHFSGRGALDRNRTLWGAFCLLGPRHRIFFSGDTGPTAEHADIGSSFGPFDIAMFEIGAFHPAWGTIHLGPDGACEAFSRIRARALLPIHWSTFDLGLHPWEEPAEQLFVRATSEQLPLWMPRIGEPLTTQSAEALPWWRDALALGA
ncbi:MAG: MBL fold metallo-hydrolase [Polyangiaceae bacterium]